MVVLDIDRGQGMVLVNRFFYDKKSEKNMFRVSCNIKDLPSDISPLDALLEALSGNHCILSSEEAAFQISNWA